MIVTNISKRDNVFPAYIKKVLSSTNPYHTKKPKELTVDRNCIVRLTLYLSMCPTTTIHFANNLLIGVLMGRVPMRM